MNTVLCGPEFKPKLLPLLWLSDPPQPTPFKSKSAKRAVKCHWELRALGTMPSPASESICGSQGRLSNLLAFVCLGKGQFIPRATLVKSHLWGRIKGRPLKTVWYLINDEELSQALLFATRAFSQCHMVVLWGWPWAQKVQKDSGNNLTAQLNRVSFTAWTSGHSHPELEMQ